LVSQNGPQQSKGWRGKRGVGEETPPPHLLRRSPFIIVVGILLEIGPLNFSNDLELHLVKLFAEVLEDPMVRIGIDQSPNIGATTGSIAQFSPIDSFDRRRK
jgi:hypothetical protein